MSLIMAPKQTDPQFKLRLPPDIKEMLDASAARNNRSVSAEILARLADSFQYDGKQNVWDRQIDDLNSKYADLAAEIERLKTAD